jgi:hypothetical protein
MICIVYLYIYYLYLSRGNGHPSLPNATWGMNVCRSSHAHLIVARCLKTQDNCSIKKHHKTRWRVKTTAASFHEWNQLRSNMRLSIAMQAARQVIWDRGSILAPLVHLLAANQAYWPEEGWCIFLLDWWNLFMRSQHIDVVVVGSPKCWSISELSTFSYYVKLLGWTGSCMQLNMVSWTRSLEFKPWRARLNK